MIAQTLTSTVTTEMGFSHGDAAGEKTRRRNRRQVAVWLLACCALVFAMVVLGGATRLTGSGLSMVRWEPISGVIPPLTAEAWEREFAHYQRSPEFQRVNYWMKVEDFKRIYWLEFWHRVLGRLIGVVFLVPLLYFLAARKLERRMTPRLVTIFLLGGLQGLLGWYMVKSGLIDNPHVSQYRLTAHLAAAVLIYSYMLWVALELLSPVVAAGRAAGRGLHRATVTLALAVFVTMLSGGFVAGLRAGKIFNTFPRMGEQWIPEGMYRLEPALLNWFENVITVQFNHRLLAIAVLVAILALWLTALRRGLAGPAMGWLHAAAAMACVQVALGIATLLLHVPVDVAVTHQGGAVVLLTLMICAVYYLRPRGVPGGQEAPA